ncbi:MAG: polymer-forming cytoskeletal protein [Spirochaetes bacterium]|nr:polymer-forming cytoskeletal protein [Spirochaetota bacterium]
MPNLIAKKSIIAGIAIFCLLLSVSAVQLNMDKNATESKIYEEDYFFFGGNQFSFDGKADDFYFFGKSLDYNGETESSLNAFGRNLEISGSIGNNLTAGGKYVNIDGQVNDTVLVGGSKVIFTEASVINGDVFVGGENITLKGTINGNVYTGSKRLYIEGTIYGNVTAFTKNKIQIGNTAKIDGNFTYDSNIKLKEEDQSNITGTVEKKEFKKQFQHFHKRGFGRDSIAAKIVFNIICAIFFLIGGLLLLLFPALKNLEENRENKHFWKTLLWGLIPFFLYPVAAILLLLLGPIGIALILAAFPIILVNQIIAAVLVGQFISRNAKWNINNRFVYFLLGFAVSLILSLIPVINFISFIAFTSLGWGVILEKLFNKNFSD